MTDEETPNDRSTNHIHTTLHCANCAKLKPRHLSPRQWNRTETGITPWGIQIFCVRCGMNVAHFDLDALADIVANPPPCACCARGLHQRAASKPPRLYLVRDNEAQNKPGQ